MQYAAAPNRTLAMEENLALAEHGGNITDETPPQDALRLKLVYGLFRPQPFLDTVDAVLDLYETLDCRYGTIRGDRCRISILLDIALFEPICWGEATEFPFAALMRTDIELDSRQRRSVPCFVRHAGMSPADNLFHRPGILLLYRQENRPRAEITESGWRKAIRRQRPLQCARACL